MAKGQTDSTEPVVAQQRKGPEPDPNTLPPREKLPDKLQKIVDNEDSLWDEVMDGT